MTPRLVPPLYDLSVILRSAAMAVIVVGMIVTWTSGQVDPLHRVGIRLIWAGVGLGLIGVLVVFQARRLASTARQPSPSADEV